MNADTIDPLPGYPPRKEWARCKGVSDFTARRWQRAGKIVVKYLGREPLVDIEATMARMRGEDRPRRGRK